MTHAIFRFEDIIPLIKPARKTRRFADYHPKQIAPFVSPIPRVLLIDSDPVFTYAFESVATRFCVPLYITDSHLSLKENDFERFDLLLIDAESIGADHLGEVIDDILKSHPALRIMALISPGLNLDAKVKTVSKEFGAESLLNDVLCSYVFDEGSKLQKTQNNNSGGGNVEQ